MRKIFSFLSIIIVFGISACNKKEDNNASDKNLLTNQAKTVSVAAYNITNNSASLKIVQTTSSDVTLKLFIKKSSDPSWIEVPFSNVNDIPVKDLLAQTAYDTKVELSKGSDKVDNEITHFTTKLFTISFAAYFEQSPKLYNTNKSLFSIEGATHTINGKGFSAASSIVVHLFEKGGSGSVTNINATILNDTTLSFAIPRDFISNSPFVVNKKYGCIIGDQPLISYYGFINKNLSDTGDFIIANRDIDINNFRLVPDVCNRYIFGGHFGPSIMGVTPDYLLGVALQMSERKILIKTETGVLVKEITIYSDGGVECETKGLANVDLTAVSQSLLAYHEVPAVNIATGLPSGNYTAQVQQKAIDGTILLSNVFSFSF